LRFSGAKPLAAYFTVRADTSSWDGSYDNRAMPRRLRIRWEDALDAQGKPGLPHAHGVYVLAFRVPAPALYIGIAADGGREPEGIPNRLRKHCVKAVGSHAGSGVTHPRRWRDFAMSRRDELRRLDRPDTLEDAVVMTGAVTGCPDVKGVYEYYESRLIRSMSVWSDALRKQLVCAMFGDEHASPRCLNGNTGSSRGRQPEQAAIVFGSGEAIGLG